MIHDCAYCNKEFKVLRKDKIYCSRSCKQMAFMKRKEAAVGFVSPKRTSIVVAKRQATNERTSGQNKPLLNTLPIDIEKLRKELYAFADTIIQNKLDELIQNVNNKDYTSEKLGCQKANSINIVGIKSDLVLPDDKQGIETELSDENVKEEAETRQKSQAVKKSSAPIEILKTEVLKDEPHKPESLIYEEEIEGVYVPIQCKWLGKLYEQFNEKGNDTWFKILYGEKEQKVEWISLHYRCLLDCVLTASNMKVIEWADLAELTNAFTFLTASTYFNELPTDYPFTKDILLLREKLKNFCLETQEEEYVQFRLKFETKKELLLQRYELASVFPKISFNQLQLDFKSENQKQINKPKEEQEAIHAAKEKPWRIKYRALKRAEEKAKQT